MVNPKDNSSVQGEDFLVDWDGKRLVMRHEKSGKEVVIPRDEMQDVYGQATMPAVTDELRVIASWFDGRLYYFAVGIGEVYKTAVARAIQRDGSMLMV